MIKITENVDGYHQHHIIKPSGILIMFYIELKQISIMSCYPPNSSGILIMKIVMKYSYPPMLSGILIIFLIDSLQKKLPSRAFRDYPPERSGG